MGTEIYPDGTNACHREYPYRPDAKISGSYPLPWDIQLAGTYQFSRGVQTGGAGPSIQANFAIPAASAAGLGARAWTGVASRTVQLIREGLMYGDHNLSQLDVRVSKRFDLDRDTAAGRLRRLQPLQQQLAVHGQLDLLDGRHERSGCGRPTCCRTASSSSAGSSPSDGGGRVRDQAHPPFGSKAARRSRTVGRDPIG